MSMQRKQHFRGRVWEVWGGTVVYRESRRRIRKGDWKRSECWLSQHCLLHQQVNNSNENISHFEWSSILDIHPSHFLSCGFFYQSPSNVPFYRGSSDDRETWLVFEMPSLIVCDFGVKITTSSKELKEKLRPFHIEPAKKSMGLKTKE